MDQEKVLRKNACVYRQKWEGQSFYNFRPLNNRIIQNTYRKYIIKTS